MPKDDATIPKTTSLTSHRKADAEDLLALYSEVAEHMSEAIVVYDRDGRLLACNSCFREMYGYSRDEARPGVHFKELGQIDIQRGNVAVGDEYGSGDEYLQRKAEYRAKLEGSFVVRLKDGRWIKTTDRRMPRGGFVSIQVDISKEKQIEKELRLAKEQAELANAAKSQFLASMSHDLRTPLNAILGFSDLMRRKTFGELGNAHYEDYVNDIHNSGALLLSLINDILDISKIEAGKYKLNEEVMDISSVANLCLGQVRTMASSSHVTIIRQLPEDLPFLYADERAMIQILSNLLSNAIKFTPDGGKIFVSAHCDNKRALSLCVRDTGYGMSEEDLKTVMLPFGQASARHSRKQEGTGLGLPICKNLMTLMGGTLRIDTKVDEGTQVTVAFPSERTVWSSEIS